MVLVEVVASGGGNCNAFSDMKRIGTCEAEGLASPVSYYAVSGGRAALSLSMDRPIDSLKATMPMDVTGI
jgi:hypothetical protein